MCCCYYYHCAPQRARRPAVTRTHPQTYTTVHALGTPYAQYSTHAHAHTGARMHPRTDIHPEHVLAVAASDPAASRHVTDVPRLPGRGALALYMCVTRCLTKSVLSCGCGHDDACPYLPLSSRRGGAPLPIPGARGRVSGFAAGHLKPGPGCALAPAAGPAGSGCRCGRLRPGHLSSCRQSRLVAAPSLSLGRQTRPYHHGPDAFLFQACLTRTPV